MQGICTGAGGDAHVEDDMYCFESPWAQAQKEGKQACLLNGIVDRTERIVERGPLLHPIRDSREGVGRGVQGLHRKPQAKSWRRKPPQEN